MEESTSNINTQDRQKRRRTTKEVKGLGMVGKPTDRKPLTSSSGSSNDKGNPFFLRKKGVIRAASSGSEKFGQLDSDELSMPANLSQSSMSSQTSVTRSPSSSIVGYFSQSKTTSPRTPSSLSPVIGTPVSFSDHLQTRQTTSYSSTVEDDPMDQVSPHSMTTQVHSQSNDISQSNHSPQSGKSTVSPARGTIEFFFKAKQADEKTRETTTDGQFNIIDNTQSSPLSTTAINTHDLDQSTSLASSSSSSSSSSSTSSNDVQSQNKIKDSMDFDFDQDSDSDSDELVALTIKPDLIIQPENDPLWDEIQSMY